MYGQECWSREAFEAQRAAAVQRVLDRIDAIRAARVRDQWERQRRDRRERDAMERAVEAERAVNAAW